MDELNLTYRLLTHETWDDFEKLMGKNGAQGGCWCMYYRRTAKEYEANKYSGNKRAIKEIVQSGIHIGLMAYDGDRAIGWCSFAPREQYPRLDTSRIMKAYDDKPVWAIVCFFIHKDYRSQGVSLKLLEAVKREAKKLGAHILEAYPKEAPKSSKFVPTFAWFGYANTFVKAGFEIVEHRSETRPLMRYYL